MSTVILHSNPFYGNPLHSNSFLHNIHLYFTAATTHTYYVNLQKPLQHTKSYTLTL